MCVCMAVVGLSQSLFYWLCWIGECVHVWLSWVLASLCFTLLDRWMCVCMAIIDFSLSLFYWLSWTSYVCLYGCHGLKPVSVLLTLLDRWMCVCMAVMGFSLSLFYFVGRWMCICIAVMDFSLSLFYWLCLTGECVYVRLSWVLASVLLALWVCVCVCLWVCVCVCLSWGLASSCFIDS